MLSERSAAMWLVGLFSIIVASHGQLPTCDYSPTQVDALNDAVVAKLRKNKFTVVEGQMKIFNSSSFGANPGNPYVCYFHPGYVGSRLPVFKLSPQTAVLFLGCTPKTTTYFSWRSYAYSSGVHLTFASLGDSLNHLVINTTGSSSSGHRNSTAAVGGRLTAVVTTADAQ